MSEEKCFCHLNGYKVKDADARAGVENVSRLYNELMVQNVDLNNRLLVLEQNAGGGGGGSKMYRHEVVINLPYTGADIPNGFSFLITFIDSNPSEKTFADFIEGKEYYGYTCYMSNSNPMGVIEAGKIRSEGPMIGAMGLWGGTNYYCLEIPTSIIDTVTEL